MQSPRRTDISGLGKQWIAIFFIYGEYLVELQPLGEIKGGNGQSRMEARTVPVDLRHGNAPVFQKHIDIMCLVFCHGQHCGSLVSVILLKS